MKKEITDFLVGLLLLVFVFGLIYVFFYLLIEGTGEWYKTCITTKIC